MSQRRPSKRKPVHKLSSTQNKGIGWQLSFHDPKTGSPTRHRFGIRDKSREPEALVTYYRRLAEYLENGPSRRQLERKPKGALSGPRT